ncbi:MAG: MBL fold metallo-hydrolase [Oscillospiraceae bacterium]|nr:MBL fold metallo-hydrolase [Oscillospiraceae bacterium]
MAQEIIRLDLGGVNAYLIKNNECFALVDTGGSLILDKKNINGRKDLIDSLLFKNGVTRDNLKIIILTHGDCDHSGNASYISHKYNAPIALNKHDGKLVNNPAINDILGNSKYESFGLRLVFAIMHKKILKIVEKVQSSFISFVPDIFLEEGDDLGKYGFDASVIFTPGHTAGSVSILTGDGDLMCGDTFGNNKKPDIAMNAEDFTMMRKSIQKIMKLNIKMVYPGHGEPFEFSEFKSR